MQFLCLLSFCFYLLYNVFYIITKNVVFSKKKLHFLFHLLDYTNISIQQFFTQTIFQSILLNRLTSPLFFSCFSTTFYPLCTIHLAFVVLRILFKPLIQAGFSDRKILKLLVKDNINNSFFYIIFSSVVFLHNL